MNDNGEIKIKMLTTHGIYEKDEIYFVIEQLAKFLIARGVAELESGEVDE